MHRIVCFLVICLLLQSVISQESPEFTEEYIDEELPESAADPNEPNAAKPANETNESSNKKAKFADDRFTQLFGPRSRNQPKPSSFFPKFASKPKPTLPPFIKRTPPIIKVSPTTQSPAQNQRQNQRATTTTQRATTTRTPSRGNSGSNRRNQPNNINNNNNIRSATPSTTSSPTTDASARRRFGASNRGRLNANATIPATTNRPRRN